MFVLNLFKMESLCEMALRCVVHNLHLQPDLSGVPEELAAGLLKSAIEHETLTDETLPIFLFDDDLEYLDLSGL